MKTNLFFLLLLNLLMIPMIWGCDIGTLTSSNSTTSTITYWNGRRVTSQESFSSQTIYVSGDISIESGATLTLSGVTLLMSCESNSQYGIFVNYGGTLNISNESVISIPTASSYYYSFWYKEGSAGSIYDSMVKYTWTPDPADQSLYDEAGLFIEADNFKIISSTIKNSNGNGVELYQASNFQAISSNFSYNGANGILLNSSTNPLISGCTISYNGANSSRTDQNGISFLTTCGTVSSSTIENNTSSGVVVDNGSPTFYSNSIRNNDMGAYLKDDNGRPNPNFGDNTISNTGNNDLSLNTTYGIYNPTTFEVMAHNNYWLSNPNFGTIKTYNNDPNGRIDVRDWLYSAP